MSEYPPGTFQFGERIIEMNTERIHRDRKSSRVNHLGAAGQPRSQAWHREALAWLGHQLVTWGEDLQERFSSGGAACGPQPVEPPAA